MVSPAIVAAGLGAVGKIGASLFGGGSKGVGVGTTVRQSVEAAREHGLHPLSVLGTAPTGYSDVDGSSLLGAISDGASGLSSALAEHKRDKLRAASESTDQQLRSRLAEKELALADAEIVEARSRTLLNEANVKRLLTGPRPPTNGTHGGIEMMDGRRIVQDPARNLAVRQDVQLGPYVATGPNPEAFEVGLSELLAGGGIYGYQWGRDFLRDLRREFDVELKRGPRRATAEDMRQIREGVK